jgi:DNA-binding transcriptional ArsR family regulator
MVVSKMSGNIYKISPRIAQVLAHDIRWQIMELLSTDESIYAKRIAETLEISESKVHYHLTQLRDAGLLTPVGTRAIKQGRAKLFKPVASQFLITLHENDFITDKTSFDCIFSRNFCDQGKFVSKIVVGSSQPHGKYDAISRDGYLAGELCWYLGNHLPLPKDFFVPNYVITDLDFEKSNHKNKTNLVLIGGHITNTLTAHYNSVLRKKFKVHFVENQIVSGNTAYSSPEHGMIALFRNPDQESRWVLILAGVRSLGTKATIFSIITNQCDLFHEETEFITIIKGKCSDWGKINGITKIISKKA